MEKVWWAPAYKPRKVWMACRACWSVTSSEIMFRPSSWLWSNAFWQTVFAPRHLASLWRDKDASSAFLPFQTAWAPLHSDLVMSSSVTRLPALTAALKQWAPTVSMATMGTSVQPTSRRPRTTPQRRPPPPTDITTAPGFTPGPREAAASAITLAWPCLRKVWVVKDATRRSRRRQPEQELASLPEQWVIEWRNVREAFGFCQAERFGVSVVPNLGRRPRF